MFERLINWLFRKSSWARDEKLKREWLEKGYERGLLANRTGLPFALVLRRADETDQAARARQIQNVSGTLSAEPKWCWWGTTDFEIGSEVCLGTLENLPSPQRALDRYLSMLRDSRDLPRVREALRIIGEREEAA